MDIIKKYNIDITQQTKLSQIFRLGEYNGEKFERSKTKITTDKISQLKTLVASNGENKITIQQIFPYKENEQEIKKTVIITRGLPKIIVYYRTL